MKQGFIQHCEQASKILEASSVERYSLELLGKDLTISDGFFTMDELYDHKETAFITLCQFLVNYNSLIDKGMKKKYVAYKRIPWRAKIKGFENSFLLGINKEPGMQISLAIPMSRWSETDFVGEKETLEEAPEFDGHSPAEAFERLKTL